MNNMTTGERMWPQTLNGEQAREFLGLGKTAFHALKAAGKLPASVSVGMKRRKYRLDDLKKYVESLK